MLYMLKHVNKVFAISYFFHGSSLMKKVGVELCQKIFQHLLR